MKVIIIYSGKGGVGKTTTTSNIAKILVEQGKKVFVLDADVNTPSMSVIFESNSPNEFIQIASLGYATQKSIYVTDSAVRSYISECISSINNFKPDYVLIDTPPSITDVHINLLNKIKPSGLLVVTQPNALSITDVNRTALFFQERDVNIIGIVENMCVNDTPSSYSWKVLAHIPLASDFNFNTVYENNKEAYANIVSALENLESVILENKKRQLFDETITWKEIREMRFKTRKDIRFVNLSTWEYVKDLLDETEVYPDLALSYLTTENIGRMMKAFETDDRAYFMVTKAPSTSIKLMTGEIGEGALAMADSYYGVPRIKYSTGQGEVVLFPYEIKPISNKELLQSLSDGYVITKDGRYLPSKDDMREVHAWFGERVGVSDNWEEHYDMIVRGNLERYQEENPLQVVMKSKLKTTHNETK